MIRSAKYASLYDTMVDDSGTLYIAKLCDGEMTWVLNTNSGCPVISACIMNTGDSLIGTDNQEYIVMMSNNTKYWSLKTTNKNNMKQNKQKDQTGHSPRRKSNGYPVISPSIMNVGDVIEGMDGNEYIVKIINGEKQYAIHQKVYTWSKSGVLYKTLDNNTTTMDTGSCPTPRQMSRSKTKKHCK